jgi:hypothetical protein
VITLQDFVRETGPGYEEHQARDYSKSLYDRRYVEGGEVKPTTMGRAVVQALEDNADIISKPDMTRQLENDMTEIAEGRKVQKDVVMESQEMLEKSLEILEFPEIKRILAGYTSFSVSRELVLGLQPQSDFAEVSRPDAPFNRLVVRVVAFVKINLKQDSSLPGGLSDLSDRAFPRLDVPVQTGLLMG